MTNALQPETILPSDSHGYEDIAARLRLVNRFNTVVGLPDSVVGALQHQFVIGGMPQDDMRSIVRLYEYTVAASGLSELDIASRAN